jgi:hypothetical protein
LQSAVFYGILHADSERACKFLGRYLGRFNMRQIFSLMIYISFAITSLGFANARCLFCKGGALSIDKPFDKGGSLSIDKLQCGGDICKTLEKAAKDTVAKSNRGLKNLGDAG